MGWQSDIVKYGMIIGAAGVGSSAIRTVQVQQVPFRGR